MTKKELAKQIVDDLRDCDLLNSADYTDTAQLLEDVQERIEYRLRNYNILIGEIF